MPPQFPLKTIKVVPVPIGEDFSIPDTHVLKELISTQQGKETCFFAVLAELPPAPTPEEIAARQRAMDEADKPVGHVDHGKTDTASDESAEPAPAPKPAE